MANIVDPDEMLHSVISPLSLHSLLRLICPNTCGKYRMTLGNHSPECQTLFPEKKKIINLLLTDSAKEVMSDMKQ